jgi:outer membrane protein TolC
MKAAVLGLALFLAVWPSSGFGLAWAAPPAQELTEQDCLALGLKQSSGVKTALSREAVAEAGLRYEKSLYLPMLQLRAYTGATDSDFFALDGLPVSFNPNIFIGPNQRLFTSALGTRWFQHYETRLTIPVLRDGFFGLGSHKIARARYTIEQSRVQVDAAKRDLATQIKDHFLAAHRAQMSRDLYLEAVNHYKSLLAMVQEKVRQKVAVRKDVLLAEAALAQAHSDLAAAENEYQKVARQLGVLLGLPGTPRLKLVKTPQQLPPLPAWESAQAKITAQNLDLKAKRLDINIAQEDLAVSRNKLWPTLDVLLRYYGSDQEHSPFRDAFASYLFLQFPLFEAPLYTNVSMKKQQVALAGDRYQVSTDQLLQKALELYKELSDIRPRLTSTQKQIDYLEENYREAKARYQQDLFSFLDLSNALLSLNNAKRELGDLYCRYLGGYRKLEDFMGDTNPAPAARSDLTPPADHLASRLPPRWSLFRDQAGRPLARAGENRP